MSNYFEVYIFTASTADYATPIVNYHTYTGTFSKRRTGATGTGNEQMSVFMDEERISGTTHTTNTSFATGGIHPDGGRMLVGADEAGGGRLLGNVDEALLMREAIDDDLASAWGRVGKSRSRD